VICSASVDRRQQKEAARLKVALAKLADTNSRSQQREKVHRNTYF
jgi:hypothetical protein